jgi:hypothetical protein
MARPTNIDVVKDFNEQLEKAEKAWSKHLLQFQHNYDAYLNNDKTREKEAKDGKLYVHHIFQQVETIVPRMVQTDMKLDLDPREGQDLAQVTALQRKIDYDLEVDHFVEKQVDLSKIALICGITVGKVIWNKSTRKIKEHNNHVDPKLILEGIEPGVVEREVTIKDGPSLVPVNLFDFFPQPGPTSIETMEHVFHRSWLTKSELEARKNLKSGGKPVFKNIDKALRLGTGGGSKQEFSNEKPEDKEGRRDDRYEVIERWKKGRLTVVVNREVLIRDCENPYWHAEIPFVAASTQPDVRSFVGISEVEVIENIANMIHKFENIRIRAAEFAVNPVLKIHRSLKGASNFEWRPGAHLYLDRADQIQMETAPANLGAAWDEVQAYLGYMQQVSGVSPYIAGADPGAAGVNQSTATGASILQQEANKRLALKLLQMQTMYSKVAKFFVQLNQQFMTKQQLVRIVGADGEQWQTVEPSDIAGMYDVRATSSTETLAKTAEIQKLTDAINTLMPMHGVPMADGTVVDIKYPLKSLLSAIGIDPTQAFAQAPQQPAVDPNAQQVDPATGQPVDPNAA